MTNVKSNIEYYVSQGFNKSQATSKAWADHFDSNPNLSFSFRIDCYCATCNVGFKFAAPGSVHTFISNHKDHKTKTMKLR